MIYNIKVIKKEQQTTNKWAGGTTTQLAINPETASYAERNFDWRLSSAVVELEESTFTKLPGYDRILMVLDGELELVHEGFHSIKLKQYEQDSFKGEWNTVSYGKARDFNLMMREGIEGSLKHYRVSWHEELVVRLQGIRNEKGQYACCSNEGAVEVLVDEQLISLDEGDLLLFEWQEYVNIRVRAVNETGSNLIEACIKI